MQSDSKQAFPNASPAPQDGALPPSSTIPLTQHTTLLSNENLSPIDRLSSEALLLIFLLNAHPPSEESTVISRSVSQVCTSWRALALSSPAMWSSIFYKPPPYPNSKAEPRHRWFEIQLERSKSASLDVVSHDFELLDFLVDHEKVGQIKRLRIVATYWRADHLTKLFSSPAGELETFDLECDHEYFYPDDAIDLSRETNFFVGPTPKLRELRLYQAYMDFSSISTATLRSLRVLKLEWPDLRKATAWLHVLQSFTELEYLHLVPDWRDPTERGLRPRRPPPVHPALSVSFPKLRKLLIQCTVPDLMECIEHLTIPPSCSVTLEGVEVDPMSNLVSLGSMMEKLLNNPDPSYTDARSNLAFSFETVIMVHGIFLSFNHTIPCMGPKIQHKLHLSFKYDSSLPDYSLSLFQPFLSGFCLHATPVSLNIDLRASPDSKPKVYATNVSRFTLRWNPNVYQWLELVRAMKGLQLVMLLLPPVFRPGRASRQTRPTYIPKRDEGEGNVVVELTELKSLEINTPPMHCEVILKNIIKPKDGQLNVTIIEQEYEDVGNLPSVITSFLTQDQESYFLSAQFMPNGTHFFLHTTLSPGSISIIPKHELHLSRGNSTLEEWTQKSAAFCGKICEGCNVAKFRTNFLRLEADRDPLVIRKVFALKEGVEVVLDD